MRMSPSNGAQVLHINLRTMMKRRSPDSGSEIRERGPAFPLRSMRANG
jgi:hypothetical protein